MARTGRKIKLTDEIIKTYTEALSIGVSRDMAARYAGVSYMSIYIWLKRGEKAIESGTKAQREQVFINLFKEVEKSEAEAVVRWQQVVDTAADKDPTWAMKMLQLRDRKNYSPTMNLVGSIDFSRLSNEQIERLANGDDPLDVLASGYDSHPGEGGAGETAQAVVEPVRPAGGA